MRHLAPRQQSGSGLWHYTSTGPHGIYAIGPCSPLEACPKCPDGGQDGCSSCCGYGFVRSQAPCPGHDTAEEACEHYRSGLLAQATFHCDVPDDQPRTVSRCEVESCPTLCSGYARVGQQTFSLCAEHRRPEVLASFVTVWESYES